MDPAAAEAWLHIPKISADGPHALQFDGLMYRSKADVLDTIDWTTPVFKLTHRLPEDGLNRGSLLDYLLNRDESGCGEYVAEPEPAPSDTPGSFAALRVSTENLGDHIQIICGLRLLSRLGIQPTRFYPP